ncbi:hypothetical protein MPH_13698, partial [Macrophomina phaseolina MS6]
GNRSSSEALSSLMCHRGLETGMILYRPIDSDCGQDNFVELFRDESYCDSCDEIYSREASTLLSCGIHKAHRNCAKADGVCPDCLPSTDVLPLGALSFLNWCGSIFCHEAKELRIHGVVNLAGSGIDYVLVSAHVSQQEKFWYSLVNLRRIFGDDTVQAAMKKFAECSI